MKLLLDTHVWLWIHLDPTRLSQKSAEVLDDRANEFWLSPISIWELTPLVSKGAMELDRPTLDWVAAALEQLPCKQAPVTYEVATAMSLVELDHRNPADRFLAASARVFDLTLLTADRQLLAGSGYRTLRAD